MASTVTIDAQPAGRVVAGNQKVRRGTLTLGTYATSGVAVTGAQCELYGTLQELKVFPSAGYIFEWLPATGKVLAYDQKDPAASGGADIALPEVGNSVDLAAVTPRFEARGF